jgi:probable addiction module antidote protein
MKKAKAKARSKPKLTKFDAAEYLDNPEVIAAYLTEAFETDDPEFISTAIGDVARAKGMTAIAEETGLSRASLYASFDGVTKTEFNTVRKVLDALDVKLVVAPKAA